MGIKNFVSYLSDKGYMQHDEWWEMIHDNSLPMVDDNSKKKNRKINNNKSKEKEKEKKKEKSISDSDKKKKKTFLHIDGTGLVFHLYEKLHYNQISYTLFDYALFDLEIEKFIHQFEKLYGIQLIMYFDGPSSQVTFFKQETMKERAVEHTYQEQNLYLLCRDGGLPGRKGNRNQLVWDLPIPPLLHIQFRATIKRHEKTIQIIDCLGEADQAMAIACSKAMRLDKDNNHYCYGNDSDFLLFKDIGYIRFSDEFRYCEENHIIYALVHRREQLANYLEISEECLVELALLIGNDYTFMFDLSTLTNGILQNHHHQKKAKSFKEIDKIIAFMKGENEEEEEDCFDENDDELCSFEIMSTTTTTTNNNNNNNNTGTRNSSIIQPKTSEALSAVQYSIKLYNLEDVSEFIGEVIKDDHDDDKNDDDHDDDDHDDIVLPRRDITTLPNKHHPKKEDTTTSTSTTTRDTVGPDTAVESRCVDWIVKFLYEMKATDKVTAIPLSFLQKKCAYQCSLSRNGIDINALIKKFPQLFYTFRDDIDPRIVKIYAKVCPDSLPKILVAPTNREEEEDENMFHHFFHQHKQNNYNVTTVHTFFDSIISYMEQCSSKGFVYIDGKSEKFVNICKNLNPKEKAIALRSLRAMRTMLTSVYTIDALSKINISMLQPDIRHRITSNWTFVAISFTYQSLLRRCCKYFDLDFSGTLEPIFLFSGSVFALQILASNQERLWYLKPEIAHARQSLQEGSESYLLQQESVGSELDYTKQDELKTKKETKEESKADNSNVSDDKNTKNMIRNEEDDSSFITNNEKNKVDESLDIFSKLFLNGQEEKKEMYNDDEHFLDDTNYNSNNNNYDSNNDGVVVDDHDYQDMFQDMQSLFSKQIENHSSTVQNDDKPLPIEAYKETVINNIEQNRVTIIQGETGSGKSSGLPQILLNHHKNNCRLMISQPRRIAAEALKDHLRSKVGDLVGMRLGGGIRDENESTRVWFVTNGYLVRLIANYPKVFEKHTHLIVDEVHDRSVDTDLLCYFVKKLMQLYPHIKIILMSATIHTDLYSLYFNTSEIPIEPIFVGARRFPLEILYLDDLQEGELAVSHSDNGLEGLVPMDQGTEVMNHAQILMEGMNTVITQDIQKKQLELAAKLIKRIAVNGTAILIFVSGMMDITNLCELFENSTRYKTIPIHSLVPIEEQREAFVEANPDEVKLIIATNAAESSLTIPDVDTVICLGIAKNIQYKSELRCTSLQKDYISKASATQRAGRTGRLRNGIVYRLYPKYIFEEYFQDHESAEVKSLPLHDVIVSLLGIFENNAWDEDISGIEDILNSLLESPELDSIHHSFDYLYENGALDDNSNFGKLTSFGKFAAALSMDIKLIIIIKYGIMLGILDLAILVCSALTLQRSPYRKCFPFNMEVKELGEVLSKALISKANMDGNNYSEPLMLVNLLLAWKKVEGIYPRKRFCEKHGLAFKTMKQFEVQSHYLKKQVYNAVKDAFGNIPPSSSTSNIKFSQKDFNLMKLILVWTSGNNIFEASPHRSEKLLSKNVIDKENDANNAEETSFHRISFSKNYSGREKIDVHNMLKDILPKGISPDNYFINLFGRTMYDGNIPANRLKKLGIVSRSDVDRLIIDSFNDNSELLLDILNVASRNEFSIVLMKIKTKLKAFTMIALDSKKETEFEDVLKLIEMSKSNNQQPRMEDNGLYDDDDDEDDEDGTNDLSGSPLDNTFGDEVKFKEFTIYFIDNKNNQNKFSKVIQETGLPAFHFTIPQRGNTKLIVDHGSIEDAEVREIFFGNFDDDFSDKMKVSKQDQSQYREALFMKENFESSEKEKLNLCLFKDYDCNGENSSDDNDNINNNDDDDGYAESKFSSTFIKDIPIGLIILASASEADFRKNCVKFTKTSTSITEEDMNRLYPSDNTMSSRSRKLNGEEEIIEIKFDIPKMRWKTLLYKDKMTAYMPKHSLQSNFSPFAYKKVIHDDDEKETTTTDGKKKHFQSDQLIDGFYACSYNSQICGKNNEALSLEGVTLISANSLLLSLACLSAQDLPPNFIISIEKKLTLGENIAELINYCHEVNDILDSHKWELTPYNEKMVTILGKIFPFGLTTTTATTTTITTDDINNNNDDDDGSDMMNDNDNDLDNNEAIADENGNRNRTENRKTKKEKKKKQRTESGEKKKKKKKQINNNSEVVENEVVENGNGNGNGKSKEKRKKKRKE